MKKILLVDDDVAFLKALKQAFENDFDVQTATGISEALSLIDNGNIAFLCSDLDMRDGTGLDLLTTLKQRNIDIPFVLMSGSMTALKLKWQNITVLSLYLKEQAII